jgi:hypothetical protein
VIQKNGEGNLSLSKEEGEILNSIRCGTTSETNIKKYPLFINGRAGSGKSTILYYLFSDILHYYIENNLISHLKNPIFLTYSPSLLTIAKESTKKILFANAHKLLKGGTKQGPIYDQIINNSFQTFNNFLLSILPEQKASEFKVGLFVDFIKFRELWIKEIKKHPDANVRNLTPELAWYVIRTYIKGMSFSIEDICDKDYFANELPHELKTISSETFNLIYDKIWDGWFKPLCKQHGYWDIQDIVQHILNSDIDLYNYPAVFCDEAQDFTKIELAFLFRLNLYSKRKIINSDLMFIPFAFAGDPMQTLNPTGFDWSAVQANFHNEIVTSLERTKKIKLQFNFHELALNYRSSKSVVNFCNLIQLVRAVTLRVKGVAPQKSWLNVNSPAPDFFNYNNPIVEEELKKQNDLVIIINGNNESDAQSEPFLKKAESTKENKSNVILTPLSAKGLEFDRVVVFKFGHEFYNDTNLDKELFKKLLKGEEFIEVDKEKLIPFQFFFNKLYVAVSRAKKRLFIIDTTNGVKNFWSYIIENTDEHILKYMDIEKVEWSEKDICIYEEGLEANWEKDKNDPKEMAEKFFNQGKSEKNPKWLIYSAQYYDSLGEKNQGNLARAMAFEYEEKYDQAAKKYIEIAKYFEAFECYWKAKNFDEMENLTKNDNTLKNREKYFGVKFMKENNNLECCSAMVEMLDDLYSEDLHKELMDSINADEIWGEIFEKFNSRISEFGSEPSTLMKTWINISSNIKSLQRKGLKIISDDASALIHFKAENYIDCCYYYEKLANTNNPNYYLSKSKISAYPDSIIWLDRLGDNKKIIYEYNEKGKSNNINTEIQKIIINSHKKEGDHSKVVSLSESFEPFEFLNDINTTNNLIHSYCAIGAFDAGLDFLCRHCSEDILQNVLITNNSTDKNVLKFLYATYITKLIKEEKFEWAINIISGSSDIKEYPQIDDKLSEFLNKTFTIGCADSEALYRNNEKLNKAVSDHLRRLYLTKPYEKNNYFSIELIGAAFEKSNTIIDCIEYYENIVSGKIQCNEAEIDFAKERWLKVKNKYLEYSENKNKPEMTDVKINIEQKLKDWNLTYIISVDQIPQFPPLDEIFYFRETQRHKDPPATYSNENSNKSGVRLSILIDEGTKHKIRIEYLDTNKRIKFTNIESDERISLIDHCKLRGEIDINQTKKFDRRIVWHIPDWEIWIKIYKSEYGTETLTISTKDENNQILQIPLIKNKK